MVSKAAALGLVATFALLAGCVTQPPPPPPTPASSITASPLDTTTATPTNTTGSPTTSAPPPDFHLNETGEIPAQGLSKTWTANVRDSQVQYRFQFAVQATEGYTQYTMSNAQVKLIRPDGQVEASANGGYQTATSRWQPITREGSGTLAAGEWKIEFTVEAATTASYAVQMHLVY